MCFCWVCFLGGFFWAVFQAVSRWEIKIWNLKSIYEPADLMCSAGSVYNYVSSWTSLHILFFLLPSQTSPLLLLKQHTLSSGEFIGCSSFVYLFNLEIKDILLFIIHIYSYLLFFVLQGSEKLDKQWLSYKNKNFCSQTAQRFFLGVIFHCYPWSSCSFIGVITLKEMGKKSC